MIECVECATIPRLYSSENIVQINKWSI